MTQETVLRDLLVLEAGARIGASVAGSALAQLGATVVYLEASAAAGVVPTKGACRPQFAAGKLSLGAAEHALLADAARAADVLILSSDIDDARATLKALASDAIVCDITACGSEGPLAGRAYSDVQVQALTGILDCTGTRESGPTPLALPLIEYMAGLYATAGILCGLRQRREQGFASAVGVSLYDVGFAAMTSLLAPVFAGQQAPPARVGNRHTMAAPWNVYRASDGWILLCSGSDEQWRRLCTLIGEPALADDPRFAKNADRVANVEEVDALVNGWVGLRAVDECVRALGELGLPCGAVAPIDGYPREANLAHRGMVLEGCDPVSGRSVFLPGSAFRMGRSPGRALHRIPVPNEDRSRVGVLVTERRSRAHGRKREGEPALPLAGVRVLEIGHYTTVPVAARTLAALGADVIKIEPPHGEAVRRWPPARNGQGIFFTFQNSDKRSITIDMDSTEDRALLARLVRGADVLVENLRPGALARKGFAPEDALALNPRLVYCSISGFGFDSLYPGRAAFDTVIQAMSGLMDVTHVDGVPLKTGPSLSDVIGAIFGLAAMLAALEHRDATGEGQHLDLSMQDISAWTTQTLWNAAAPAAAPLVRPRADGPGYVLGEGEAALPILGVAEVLAAPHTRARRLWFEAEMEDATFPLLAVPLRLPATPPVVRHPAPRLGRDNEAIRQEAAALDEAAS